MAIRDYVSSSLPMVSTGGAYVVRDITTTNVQERACEVTVRHLQSVVDGPQRGRKAITSTRESTARGRVRLKHHKFLSKLLGDAGGIQIRLDDALPRGMCEIVGEDRLRIFDGSEATVWEFRSAVLVRVAVAR